ncbi:hypothetical protein BH10ACI3_BH10ACI3_06920 [soil metagenome]
MKTEAVYVQFDDSIGVFSEQAVRFLDPLLRVQNDRSRYTGGSGLGLAIVKTCIEACNGSVFARNLAPHGLEIVITLSRSSN